MNENNNRVAAAFTDAELAQILMGLQSVEALLQPYMVGLSPEERMALPKINVDNKAFAEDAINTMRDTTAAQILPAFLKPDDAEADLKMFDQLEQIYTRLTVITGRVESTRILAGSEAYTTALSFKRLADAAEMAGVPGANVIAARLRERFKGQGPSSGPADTNPNPEPAG